MIYIERTITINKNEATIEEPIVLYKGDKNIEIQFTIENNPFKYKSGTEATYGQLVIKRPSTGPIFTDSARLSNGRVLFTIEDGMIDEEIEIGSYDFQIRLINTDMTSRGTLPPVTAGIIIKEPICEEAIAGTTYVNSRRAVIINSDESDEVFGENGDYNRTNWSNGDIITDTRLNKIEEALYEINNNVPNDYATEEYVDNQRRQTETYAERYTDNAISRINLDSYATYTYVDNQRTQTEAAAERYTDNAIGRMNLDNYATHSYVDSEITKLDINKYATQEYVDDAVSNISGGGNVDLTGYATEAYVNEAIANNKPNLDGVATEQYVIDYTSDALGKYATKSYVDKAVANIEGGGTGGGLNIMTIGNGIDEHTFTGDEFTYDDYNNNREKSVLLCNVVIHAVDDEGNGSMYYYDNELVFMKLSSNGDSDRFITIYSPHGREEQLLITEDGTITLTQTSGYVHDTTLNKKLGNYATQDYVDEAVANIEGGGSGSNLDIMVIGDDDPNESYYFTGNEFTKDDYNNRMCKSVLMRNRVIIKAFDEFGNEFRQIYNNELVYVQLRNNDRREIYIYSPRGRQDSLYLTEDGVLQFIDSSSYATYTAIDIALENQIGNINAILDSINGEEI